MAPLALMMHNAAVARTNGAGARESSYADKTSRTALEKIVDTLTYYQHIESVLL